MVSFHNTNIINTHLKFQLTCCHDWQKPGVTIINLSMLTIWIFIMLCILCHAKRASSRNTKILWMLNSSHCCFSMMDLQVKHIAQLSTHGSLELCAQGLWLAQDKWEMREVASGISLRVESWHDFTQDFFDFSKNGVIVILIDLFNSCTDHPPLIRILLVKTCPHVWDELAYNIKSVVAHVSIIDLWFNAKRFLVVPHFSMSAKYSGAQLWKGAVEIISIKTNKAAAMICRKMQHHE